MVALSQIRCLLTRRPAPSRLPPGFSWPPPGTSRKTTLRVVTGPLRFQTFHHHRPKGRLVSFRFFPKIFPCDANERWQHFVRVGCVVRSLAAKRSRLSTSRGTIYIHVSVKSDDERYQRWTDGVCSFVYRPGPFFLSCRGFSFGFDIPEVGR